MSAPSGPGVYIGVVDIDYLERAAHAIDIDLTASPAKVLERPVVLLGLVVKTGAGGAGTVELFDSTDGTGNLVAGLTVAASSADTEPVTHGGVWCGSGLSATFDANVAKATALVLFTR